MQDASSTRWSLIHRSILDIPAEVVVCSANVQLNMSGGVNGALLVKYGEQTQLELRRYLQERSVTSVAPGTVVVTESHETPYRFVLHAVAIDVFYQSSRELVFSTLKRALDICVEHHIETVALTAVATGYGRFPLPEFAEVLQDLSRTSFPGVKSITLAVENEIHFMELHQSLRDLRPDSFVFGESI